MAKSANRLHPEVWLLGSLPLPQIQPTCFATLYPLKTQPMTRPLATPFVIFCVCVNNPPAGGQQRDTIQPCIGANMRLIMNSRACCDFGVPSQCCHTVNRLLLKVRICYEASAQEVQ